MEPVASVSLDTADRRSVGWQVQLRVDYVVNRLMQTHRGQSADDVAQAITDQLRSVGVLPNTRLIQQYALTISQLPLLPPRKD